MLESHDRAASTPADDEIARLTTLLAETSAERDHLREEVDASANRDVEVWLKVVDAQSRALEEIQQTVSWRVTKPLRFVRRVQGVASDAGWSQMPRLGVEYLRRRIAK